MIPEVLADSADSESTKLLWTKIVFIIVAFAEALVCGLIPTFSKNCRESPKILGIANAFAGGVFIAIAFMHILPEQIHAWDDYMMEKKSEGDPFPLPEMLTFIGYTLILMIDKVLFDSSALFADKDPAVAKLQENVKASMVKVERASMSGDREEMLNAQKDAEKELDENIKSYLNP
jgi:zinc transporter ZupT